MSLEQHADTLAAAAAARNAILAELERRKGGRFQTIFPDDGPFRRELYPKHMAFLAAGSAYKERLFMKANRVGGTRLGTFEVTCHLTGRYPAWWTGRRFLEPIEAWACGTTSETTRDIVQAELLGKVDPGSGAFTIGTGMLPPECIVDTSRRPHGLPGSIESIWIRHVTGGLSVCGLKTYAQGRESFEGTAKSVVWCLAERELVQMADGQLLPIEHVREGDYVLSLDADGRPVRRQVLRAVDQGMKPCVKVQPKHGTAIVCTSDHDIFWGYNHGSKRAAEDATAVAQIRPGWWPTETTDRDDAWYVWTALVIAGRKVTNGDIASMEKAIAMLPVGARVRRKDFKNAHVPDWFLVWPELWAEWAPAQRRHPTESLHRSEEKAIPGWVFTSSREKAALFLHWLYMGDGWANGHVIGYATTSRRLAEQVIVLLNRLGIRACLRTRYAAKPTWRDQFWVKISCSSEVLTFLDVIGIEGKVEAVEAVRTEARRREASKSARAQHLVTHGRREYAHKTVAARVKASRVLSVEPVGDRHVYDITVENEHRFLCGTSLVSNCDEEPPEDVYTEGLYRTATTKGIVLITFTPLQGMSKVVTGFLTPERDEAKQFKWYIQAGWNDVPHLDEDEKAALIATTPPYLLEARTAGTPSLGAGAIFPIPEADITVKDFPIPEHWPKAFAMDHGWNWFGAVFMAYDRDTQTRYLYSCYKRSQAEPPIHAEAIKARGAWLPGVGDCSDINKYDGQQFLSIYRDLGLTLRLANKAVETGLTEVWKELSTGKLKVFASCEPWFAEYRLYHRNEHGVIVKANDHLMDCFDEQTQVLTTDGWFHFAQLNDNHLLATVNLATDEIEYQRAIGHIARDYIGPMVRIGGRKMDALVTPNHRMVVYPRDHSEPVIKAAGELTIWDRIKLTAQWTGEARGQVSVKMAFGRESRVDPEVWAELLGWYVAEGWGARTPTCPGRGYQVGISQQTKKDQLEALLAQTPWPWQYRNNGFEVSCRWLWEQLAPLGNKYTKRVPRWVKDSEPRIIRAFLRGAILGDGWVQNGAATYATVSQLLADDIQELYLKVGRTAGVRIGRMAGSMTINGRTHETVDQHWTNEWKTPTGYLRNKANVPNVETVQYAGRVYCATVPNGTLIVRRNGSPMIAGNCTRYLVRAGWQIFKTEAEAGFEASGEKSKKDPFERFTGSGGGGATDGWMGA